MRMLPVAVLAILVLVVGACDPAPQGDVVNPDHVQALHVVNVSGPAVQVLQGSRVVETLACGHDATFLPTDLGGLPWELAFRAVDDGTVLGTTLVGSLPSGVMIRGRDVITGGWPMAFGPDPSPLDLDPCASPPVGG